MGYESLTGTKPQPAGFSLKSIFSSIFSYLLLPPLLALYALGIQFLTALDLVDRIAENKTVQRIVQLSLRAGVILAGLVQTVLGKIFAPVVWIGNTFVFQWVWIIYNWAKKRVHTAFGWKTL